MRWGLALILAGLLHPVVIAQEIVIEAATDTATASLAVDEPSREDIALEAYVDGVMATYRQLHAAPGYSVAVVRPDRVVFAKGYGYADVENGVPVSGETTRFYVASISKTFVWTAAMILVDRGELDLDRDVNDYLKRLELPPGKRPLTLNDLMTHRAGFEESLDLFTPEIAAMDIEEAMKASQPVQSFARGERAAYSNWGSNLVALIIEDVTGETFETFLYRDILEPLGMTATVLTENSPNAGDTEISKNYRVKKTGPEEVPQVDLGAFAPIGGITTTAADMARWMRFHLNQGDLDGVRLMSDASYALMRSRHFDEVPGAPTRAHGFADVPYRNTLFYGHTGSINAFYSNFLVSPDLGVGVFISQNTSDSFQPLSGLPERVFDYFIAARDGEGFYLRTTPPESDQEAAEEIAGAYISNRRVMNGLQKALALFDGALEIGAKDGYLISGSRAAYQRIGDDLWENRDGARLAVVRNEDGSIARLMGGFGSTHLEPVTFWSNPKTVQTALMVTIALAIASWLGLWRRLRQQRESTNAGRWLSLLALLGLAPFIWIGVLSGDVSSVQDLSFAEIFDDWPPAILLWIATAATLAALVGVLMVIGVPFAWKSTQWNLIRKLHYTAYAASYGFLTIMLISWDIVPHIPGIHW
ncbi:MAG: serine hydrolase domain-containing protein [Pseudomonadota bacterium]